MFNIEEDAKGERKKRFLSGVAARFRKRRADLVARFIKNKAALKEGSAHANLKPWEVYDGQFDEDTWKVFEEKVNSDAFKVNTP